MNNVKERATCNSFFFHFFFSFFSLALCDQANEKNFSSSWGENLIKADYETL